MEDKRIVMLAGEGDSTNILYNAINGKFPIQTVILEGKEDKNIFIKRRIKRLGIVSVSGQVLFQLIIVKILNLVSGKRVKKIIEDNHLDISDISDNKIIKVSSINDNKVKELLVDIKPDLIIVNGTRIISKKILVAVSCPIINTHTGITPMYRGVHGGYWALVRNDKENCGVTVHLVDAGIDTGEILYQDIIEITARDNFVTYPYLQTAKAKMLLQKAVNDALYNNIQKVNRKGNSNLWYHPTIWQYLYFRIFKNVK